MTDTSRAVELVEALAQYAEAWRRWHVAADEGVELPTPEVVPVLIDALSERGGNYFPLLSDRSQGERFLGWYRSNVR